MLSDVQRLLYTIKHVACTKMHSWDLLGSTLIYSIEAFGLLFQVLLSSVGNGNIMLSKVYGR